MVNCSIRLNRATNSIVTKMSVFGIAPHIKTADHAESKDSRLIKIMNIKLTEKSCERSTYLHYR